MPNIKASDQITITDLTDAYAVGLTSEAYTFIGGVNGAASGGSCSTSVYAICGATACTNVNVTASDIVCPAGITASVADSGKTNPTITFTLSAVLTDTKEIEIPIIVINNGTSIEFTKKFTIAVAKQGTQGNPGQNGTSVTVTKTEYAYQLSSSGTTVPTGEWKTTPQAPTTSQYAWTRTTTTFSDGKTAVTYTVGGKVGAQGNPGQNGTSPTVSSTTTQYQKSTNGTVVPTGNWSNDALAPDVNNYVWTKTTITYSDGATAVTYAVAGKTGAQGNPGADAVTISVTTANGTVFKNNSGTTKLTAHVYKAGSEQTVNANGVCGSLGTVKWYKGDPKDTQPSGWPKAAGELTVSASDVADKQAYTCQLEG